MKSDVYRRLRDLSEKRDKEFGKLVQKLLAIAFCDAGAIGLVERSTQGIDLEIDTRDGQRVALEVKTAQGRSLKLDAKDLAGLERHGAGGRQPYLALLGARPLDDWIFARCPASEIRPQKEYALTLLRAYRDVGLEAVVRETFPAAVVLHGAAAIDDGQGALDRVLRHHPAYRTA